MLHRVPVLWRMHRTHHSDLDVDFSTGVRFHPFEALYTTLILSTAIVLLGAPPVAVLRLRRSSVARWTSSSTRISAMPAALDRALRLVIVTPDMHRIHHSQDMREGNANFSNTFSWWDRMFGTYLEQPAAGHEGVTFGVEGAGRAQAPEAPLDAGAAVSHGRRNRLLPSDPRQLNTDTAV